MSKRSTWCEFSNEERKYMKNREENKCAICHKSGALEAMHIFLSRAKGGRGIRTNGVMGCCICHRIMDNPIGASENELSKQYMEYCKNYLIEKENIKDIRKLKEELIYHKQEQIIDMAEIIKDIQKDQTKYCKSCKNLIKTKNPNSTMPAYYCKYKKMYLNKTMKACKKYEYTNITS